MHHRRLATLLLGAWIAGSLFMAAVAAGNFRAIDEVLDSPAPPVAESIENLQAEKVRILLRVLASEQNRRHFELWEWAQLGLGLALVGTLIFGSHSGRISLAVCGLLVVLVALQRWLLTPELVASGKAMELAYPHELAAEEARFAIYHRVYSGLELAKIGLAAGLSARFLLLFRSRRRRPVSKQVDAVHHADHSGVNR
jgi:hypothetical protein